MGAAIENPVVIQLGFVVEDVEKTGRKFAEFLGMDCPPTIFSGDPVVVKSVYQGQESKATCHMKFFDTPGLQLELIQPDEHPSVWRDFLNERGQGLHHMAFRVQHTDEAIETLGYPLMQRGLYGDGSGQYSYLDARSELSCIVELLENFA